MEHLLTIGGTGSLLFSDIRKGGLIPIHEKKSGYEQFHLEVSEGFAVCLASTSNHDFQDQK